MASCWVCRPNCDNCKPKFYTCPACGKTASLVYGKCNSCGRPMTQGDKERGIAEWERAVAARVAKAVT